MNRLLVWITPQFATLVATLILLLSTLTVWAATALELAIPSGEKITLYQTSCTHDGIMLQIRKEAPKDMWGSFKQAEYRDASGKVFAGCWILVPQQGAVFLVYEDGERGVAPAGAFKPRVDA